MSLAYNPFLKETGLNGFTGDKWKVGRENGGKEVWTWCLLLTSIYSFGSILVHISWKVLVVEKHNMRYALLFRHANHIKTVQTSAIIPPFHSIKSIGHRLYLYANAVMS